MTPGVVWGDLFWQLPRVPAVGLSVPCHPLTPGGLSGVLIASRNRICKLFLHSAHALSGVLDDSLEQEVKMLTGLKVRSHPLPT